ncbi:dynamin-binding protein-like isoform X2 [Dendronephthya gigantea]|nr:dynamin-binding protein-like isoform X2 [Dendronephthya gigantea]
MAKSFVRALYDYHSCETGDLNFNAGDVIQVLNLINENWIKGEHEGNSGLFPANFVEPLTTSSAAGVNLGSTSASQSTATSGKTVVANDTYISGEDGMLTFFRGDKLTFLSHVDEHWCRGSIEGEVGLFPIHMVEGLDDSPAPQQVDLAVNVKNVTEPKPQINNQQTPPQEHITNSTAHAKALFDFKALTELELSFSSGQVIALTKEFDAEWFEGTCDGITGIFPKSFVEVLVPLPGGQAVTVTQPSTNEQQLPRGQDLSLDKKLPGGHFSSGGDDGINVPYAVAVYPFVGETSSELSFREGEVVFLHRWVSAEWIEGECHDQVGIFPSSFVQIKQELPQNFEEVSRSGGGVGSGEVSPPVKEEFMSSPFTTGDQAKAIYSYESCIDGDLCLEVGDLVLIEQIYDDEWVLARKDENTGVCPAVFLELHAQLDGLNLSSEFETSISKSVITDRENSNGKMSEQNAEPRTLKNDGNTFESEENFVSSFQVKPRTPRTDQNKPLASKPLIAPKPDFLKKPAKPVSLPVKPVSLPVKPVLPPKPVTPTGKHSGFVKPNENNWVKFEDDSTTSSRPAKTQPKPTPISRNKSPRESPRMSYKTLLDRSLEEDLTKPLSPEQSRGRPLPPPRVDVSRSRSSTPDALSSKLMEQADAFEKSSSRQNSPSLNELRESGKTQKPVPAKRTRKPLTEQGGSNQGFPIIEQLDEQITKLKNELQKENQILSGVAVLIETVNKDTSRREELEAKKGITQRKIEDLRKQLKKIEDQKKRLMKLLDGYSSQEEIDLKIEQLRESIKENTDTKMNLESLLSGCEEDEERDELQDNISFCDKAIKNLKSELDSLLDLVSQLKGEVTKEFPEKDVTHRKKIIDEILATEKSFGRDLNLCLKNFMMNLIEWKVEAIDCDLLFGNMEDVADLSSRLLERLESATDDIDINEQIVGKCFVDFSEEMTMVYGKYCRNHDEAIAFLEKCSNNEETRQYIQKCLESIREFSNCWDLSSFLIKPVQRILKYPLLLNELLKNTPDDHPDKPGLIEAIEVMTVAANDVNEFKRRKELVQKYQKAEESGLSTKFQKFTWHSLLKKSSRFNQRITQFTGLVSQTVDEKFNENERLFYQIEKTAKNLIKNITQYLELFEDVHSSQVQSCENITDFCKDDGTAKDIQGYTDAERYIGEHLVNQLKHVLDGEVLSPLTTLINLFQGPHRLIQKRHDKCLDYDSLSNKVEKIKDQEKWRQAKDELDFAKKTYEALNTQLLDELPVLNTKSLKFLQTCITNFACVHKNFFVEALDQFSPSVQLSVVNAVNMDIISDFSQSKIASHEVFQLAFTSKKSLTLPGAARPNLSPKTSRSNQSVDNKLLNPRSLTRSASESKRKAPVPPSDASGGVAGSRSGGVVRSRTVSAADRSLLVRKRVDLDLEGSPSRSSNYIVKYEFTAEAPTELSVNKNDIVRVTQYHDAFGHNEWWKCEHNGKIGFVPSSFLAPCQNISIVTKRENMTKNTGQGGMVAKSGQSSMVLNAGQTRNGGVLKPSVVDHLVKYDFKSDGPNELDVVTGELVRVIEHHDVSGSPEWWLVEARGKQGYVPASYLVKNT